MQRAQHLSRGGRLASSSFAVVLAASVTLVGLAAGVSTASPAQLAPARVGAAPAVPAGATALGAMPRTTLLHVDVVLQPRDPAALARFASEVSTPGSRFFRHYLPRGAFPGRFGPTASAIAAVERSLRAAGLRPGAISGDHLSIPLTATVGQLAEAFSTSFVRYRLGGRVAFASTSAPLVSGAVKGFVQGVIGLDDLYLPHRLDVVGRTRSVPQVWPHVVTGGPQPCAAAVAAAPTNDAYTADELASAYDFSSLYGAGDEGSGVTVGIFELEPNLAGDISAYQSCYGTSASVVYTTVDGGAGSGAGSSEAALDIEDVIGLAPKAAIDVYQGLNGGTGAYDTYSAMITADKAQVISTSWGVCEPEQGSTQASVENTLFQDAATQGQSIFSAAGDSGSEDCGSGALAVDDPASQSYVTSVGGTTTSTLGLPPGQTVWNSGVKDTGAGGGGISSFWTMPSYQSGAPSSLNVINSNSSGTPCAAPSGTYCREVPDVSADADPTTGYLIYFDGSWIGIGGTSAAAPLWAAFAALVDGSTACAGTAIGFANPELYKVASTSYSSSFFDVTSGNNDYIGSNGGLYPAGTGYDMASGLGTPDGAGLPAQLCTAAAAPVFTSEASDTVGAGTAFTYSVTTRDAPAPAITLAPGSTLPSGVTLTDNGNGTATLAGTSSVTAGVYTFTIEATNSGGSIPQTFTLTVKAPAVFTGTPALQLSSSRVTYGHEQSDQLSVTVSSLHSGSTPAGSVTIKESATALCVIRLKSAGGSCRLTPRQLKARTYRLVATYGHSNSAKTLTIERATSKTVLKLSARRVTYGLERVEHLSIMVFPQYSGGTPTGTVTIKESTARLCVIRLSSAKGSCVLSADRLAPGSYRLVAVYGGSVDFDGSSVYKVALTVGK